MIDSYFPVLDSIDERLDALEARVYKNPSRMTLAAIQHLKAELRDLHAAAWPQRDTAASIDRAGAGASDQ